MDNRIIDFLTDLGHDKTADDVFQTLVKHIKGVGFDVANYVYAQNNENGETLSHNLTNFDPKWIEYYDAEGLANEDYAVQHLLDQRTDIVGHHFDTITDDQMGCDRAGEIWSTVKDLGMKTLVAIPFGDIRGLGGGGIGLGSSSFDLVTHNKVLKQHGTFLISAAHIAHTRMKRRYMSAEVLGLNLSKRQKEMIEALAMGLSNKAIAAKLNMTEATVSFHLKATAEKLDVRTTREILPKAIAYNLIHI